MYYDNKSSFYIRQYGPAVLILILSFLLIGSGIYIYISSNKNTPNKEIIVASDSLKDENKTETETETSNVETPTAEADKKEEVVEEKKEEVKEDTSLIPADYENLKPLEKTENVKVTSVLDSGKLKVTTSSSKVMEITLIGIDFSNAQTDIISKMKSDLEGKEIKLAFDNTKVDNLSIFAYIYIKDTLYNAKMLEQGYASLKEEKNNNTSLYTTLKQSQTYAKQTLAGIWKK